MTATSSPTPTQPPTPTPSPTESPTPNPSPTPIPSPTPTPSSTPTPTPTATPTPASITATAWEPYFNPQHGYSINVPEGWTLYESDRSSVLIVSPSADAFLYVFSVFIQGPYQLEQAATSVISFRTGRSLYEGRHHFDLISRAPTTFASGAEGMLIEFTDKRPPDGCRQHVVDVFLFAGTPNTIQGLELVGSACESVFHLHVATMERMQNTFLSVVVLKFAVAADDGLLTYVHSDSLWEIKFPINWRIEESARTDGGDGPVEVTTFRAPSYASYASSATVTVRRYVGWGPTELEPWSQSRLDTREGDSGSYELISQYPTEDIRPMTQSRKPQ